MSVLKNLRNILKGGERPEDLVSRGLESFSQGQIVYFKSEFMTNYGEIVSHKQTEHEYRFKPGDRYIIKDPGLRLPGAILGMMILNTKDNSTRFVSSEIAELLVSEDEWREIQIDKILE
jgi:hypothetical protein